MTYTSDRIIKKDLCGITVTDFRGKEIIVNDSVIVIFAGRLQLGTVTSFFPDIGVCLDGYSTEIIKESRSVCVIPTEYATLLRLSSYSDKDLKNDRFGMSLNVGDLIVSIATDDVGIKLVGGRIIPSPYDHADDNHLMHVRYIVPPDKNRKLDGVMPYRVVKLPWEELPWEELT